MEYAGGGYRIKILGELQVFSGDGVQLTVPKDRVMQRLLIALALRSGRPRRLDELVGVVWPGDQSFGRDSRSLETPVIEIERQYVDKRYNAVLLKSGASFRLEPLSQGSSL